MIQEVSDVFTVKFTYWNASFGVSIGGIRRLLLGIRVVRVLLFRFSDLLML